MAGVEPELLVLPDEAQLASDVATRTLAVLHDAQAVHSRASLALTAGSIMEQVWAMLAAGGDGGGAANSRVDWSRVDVFWGDERFVPADSPDRNDGPARAILLSKAPFSAAAQYPMPASDGKYGADLDAAAAGYAIELAAAAAAGLAAGKVAAPGRAAAAGAAGVRVPAFDVVLLGLGPDGHCASLFPDHPGVHDQSSSVIAVRNSPKPPPNRISLSFDGLNCAKQIWVVAAGSEKANAVAMALGGADRVHVPSAGARGTDRTLWLIDQDAAAKLPPERLK